MRRAPIILILSLVALHYSASLYGQDQPVRPAITVITHVRLWSADPRAAVDIYSKVLGLTSRDAGCAGMVRPCYILSEQQQITMAKRPSVDQRNPDTDDTL